MNGVDCVKDRLTQEFDKLMEGLRIEPCSDETAIAIATDLTKKVADTVPEIVMYDCEGKTIKELLTDTNSALNQPSRDYVYMLKQYLIYMDGMGKVLTDNNDFFLSDGEMKALLEKDRAFTDTVLFPMEVKDEHTKHVTVSGRMTNIMEGLKFLHDHKDEFLKRLIIHSKYQMFACKSYTHMLKRAFDMMVWDYEELKDTRYGTPKTAPIPMGNPQIFQMF